MTTRDRRLLWFVVIPQLILASYLVGPYCYYGIIGFWNREPFYGFLPRSYYLNSLRTGDRTDRVQAVHAIGHWGKKDRSTLPIDALIAALHDNDPGVRVVAAQVIGWRPWDAPSTAQCLVSALRDEDEGVRRAAAYSLKQIDRDTAQKAGVDLGP